MKNLLSIGLPFLFIILLLAAPAQAEEGPYSKYGLEVKLDPEAHTISGFEQVEYYNGSQTPLSSLYFLLLPNFGRERNPYRDSSYIDGQYWNGFDPSWTRIEAVTTPEGEELEYELMASPPELQTYSLQDTILRVDLPQPLPPSQTVSVRIEFTTKFPHMITGDQSYHRHTYTWRFGWNPIAVPPSALLNGEYLAEEKEYYKYLLPAAWYEAQLTLPADYVLASGPDEQKTVNEDEDWKTVLLRSATPVRSIPFSAGPDFKWYGLEHHDIEIDVYHLPGHEGAARLFATYAAEILDRYQELYGPYSHKRLVIAESPAPGLFGITADGLVILGNSAFGEKDLGLVGVADRLIEYLLAHEIAHLWFGIGAGADLNAENFLSEAFAQYLSISYYEEKYGGFAPNVFVFERPGLLEGLIEHQLGFYNLRQHNVELPYLQVFKDRFDEALIKPEKEVEYGNRSSVRIYDKGYLVLRALAGVIGREKVQELLARAYQEYHHRILTVEELKEHAEEISGQGLGEFFQDWLYTAQFIDYGIRAVETTARGGEHLTEIVLTKRGGAALPVEVVAVTEQGEEFSKTWDAEKTEGVIRFASPSPVREVQVDPKELTPDVNRLNNFYPPKFRVITTGKEVLPLDAYLLRFDPTTQTLEGGTLWHRWLLGQGIGAFAIYSGRGATARGYLDLGGLDRYGTLAGELELDLAGFSHPQVGSPAKFWEETDRLRLSVGRTLEAASGEGINYLRATWKRTEAVQDLSSTELSLAGFPFEFARFSVQSWHRFRLLPHLYLDEEVSLGFGYNLPEPFRFNLDELQSFYHKTEEGKWEKAHFPGTVKLSGRLSLSLPAKREMDYDLANLAVIDEVRQALFLAGGQSWEVFEDIGFGNFKLEAGFEGEFVGRTLGGLFPLHFTIGFAYPFLGIEPENRRGRIYFGVRLPLL